jgi:hypothetical protein
LVYKAEDLKLHRFVGLKLLRDEVAKSPKGAGALSVWTISLKSNLNTTLHDSPLNAPKSCATTILHICETLV